MTLTFLIAILPLIGLGLCVWAVIREPLAFVGSAGLWCLIILMLHWIV